MRCWSDWVWSLYSKVPNSVEFGGLHFFRFLQNLISPFPILMLRMSADELARPFSVLVAGELPWAEYLPQLLFPVTAERTSLGKVPLWRLARTLRAWGPSVDLMVVRVDRVSSRLFFGNHYLRVPELVDLHLEVPQNIEALYSGNRNRNLKNDLRRVRRNRLTAEISHLEADLQEFYEQFHVPFVRRRFGKFAWPHNRTLLGGLFRQGGLIWTLQHGRRLGGCVYVQRGQELSLLAIGTVDGDDSVTELGVQVALFHGLVELAADLGCNSVNLGGSRPLLTDGSLRFKRKWGARLTPREASNHLLLHWERLDTSTARALSGTALVFVDQGHLSAIGTLDRQGLATSEDVSRAVRFLSVPGLHKLYLCSASGFEPGLDLPQHTYLIDLKDDESIRLPQAVTLKPFGAHAAHAFPPWASGTAG